MNRAPPRASFARRRGEFDLIASLFAPLSRRAPGAFGLMDDAARLDLPKNADLVTTVDTVIAGVHFREDDPPALIARKALRVNLSDLAAKGAKPFGFLQALMLNEAVGDGDLRRYATGLAADIDVFGIPLLGGDTTSGPGPFAISITAFGTVPRGAIIQRSGARPGHLLCVTGTIGDGALGLACVDGTLKLPARAARALTARYRLPQPRVAAGQALRGQATACVDISDGLVADVGHICAASGVGAIIDREAVPLSSAARAALGRDPRLWSKVLGGGDDYELAFALPPRRVTGLARLATAAGVALTVIGRFVPAKSAKLGDVAVLDESGRPVAIPVAGYRHR